MQCIHTIYLKNSYKYISFDQKWHCAYSVSDKVNLAVSATFTPPPYCGFVNQVISMYKHLVVYTVLKSCSLAGISSLPMMYKL